MYLKIYLYNWKNHNKLHQKPHFEQMGPYVFRYAPKKPKFSRLQVEKKIVNRTVI